MAIGAVDTAIAARQDAARQSDTGSNSARVTLAVLTAWASVIVVAHVLLERIQAAGANIRIQAAPLVGTFDLRVSGRLIAAFAVGTVVVFGGPRLVERLGWRTLLVASAAAAALWAVSLALVDGVQGLTSPLEARTEYLADVFAETERARAELGFTAGVGFEEGVCDFASAPLRAGAAQ